MTDLPATIAAVTALVVAIGAFVLNLLKNRGTERAAIRAAEAAEASSASAAESKVTLVEIKGQIFELGKAVDGRLSKLLEQTEARGKAEGRALHAEGVTQGEKAERARSNGDGPK